MQLPKGLPLDAVLGVLYQYIPSKGAAVAAVVLYALLSVAVAAVSFKTRLHYMLLVALTALLELAGWATRLSTFATAGATAYSVHQALLIISPALLAIVQYITLSKLIQLARPGQRRRGVTTTVVTTISMDSSSSSSSRSPEDGDRGGTDTEAGGSSAGNGGSTPNDEASSYRTFSMVVLVFFMAGQVLCLLLETSGGALYSDLDTNELYGRMMLLAGLGLQWVFDSAFIALTAVVQRSRYFGFRGDRSFRPVFTCLYATTLLLHWRNVFRIAEFSQGRGGDVAKHEVHLYVFDFMPLYACFLLYTFMHYGFWLGPHAPAMVARGAAVALEPPAAGDKQQQQSPPEGDTLHVHCS